MGLVLPLVEVVVFGDQKGFGKVLGLSLHEQFFVLVDDEEVFSFSGQEADSRDAIYQGLVSYTVVKSRFVYVVREV